MTHFYSEALGKRERSAFACGNEIIDTYFRTMASQDVKRRYAACYVLVERSTEALAGFYTLSSSMIPLQEIPADLARKLPLYPTVPAILIGWLGRSLAFRGAGIGELLLHDAIARVAGSAAGAYALIADAIDDDAKRFYIANGFIPMTGVERRLFIPIATAIRSQQAGG